MKITLFGASGGVGLEVARQATERGHFVRAVFRSEASAQGPFSEKRVLPDFRDPQALAEAVAGTEVVISALGLRRQSQSNPYSKLLSPPDFNTRFSEALVAALKSRRALPTRVLAVSAAGVGTGWKAVSLPLQLLFRTSTVRWSYPDLEQMEATYRGSGLDVTCVQPTSLTNGPRTGKVMTTPFYGFMDRVSRADVAWYLLELASIAQPGFRSMAIKA